jgi:hypothetical protein
LDRMTGFQSWPCMFAMVGWRGGWLARKQEEEEETAVCCVMG